MPRKSRKQPGASGGAYPNRTDLTQPISVPTGLPYGERQELVQAQQQAPLPQQAQGIDQAVQAAQAHQFQPVGLSAPTQRPNEPIQHGLPSGPGAGPEVLQPMTGASSSLQQLAATSGSPAIAAMAERARRYGI